MKLIISPLLMLALVAPLAAADTKQVLDETRAILKEWISTRQTLAEQKSAWEVEKQTLQQSIQLHEAEIKLLTEEIKQAEELSSAADKEWIAQEQLEAVVKEAAASVEAVVDDLETQLVKASKAFPKPLQEKIAPLALRIPEPDKRKTKSISERMQNIVGILGEVDKFNNTISTFTEIRKGSDGGEFQVETMYLGLGQGFFTDVSGNQAGVGFPMDGKWQWVDKPELGARIKNAMAMYRNVMPAEFVGLDVTVR